MPHGPSRAYMEEYMAKKRKESDTNQTSKKKQNPALQKAPEGSSTQRESFPVVGLGSSAGGLEALQIFFSHMPVDSGMAFVVVTHQHPGHESVLPELLRRETDMPAHEITDGMSIEPDQVYVLGPGSHVTIDRGVLHLMERGHAGGHDAPIDIFFRSLAHDMHERAIAIVLSGTGSDGTLGIKEVKAQGGMIVVQEPSAAKYGGMPTSARDTGVVDFIEPPEKMPECMQNYANGPYLQPRTPQEDDRFTDKDLEAILRFIRSRIGHDFSSYKRSTIHRRIERRMSVHGLEKAQDYLDFLHENRQETQMLFSELLISVTSFFRDPEAFKLLQEKYLTELVVSRPDNHEFRVWVPGCATGEEVYSIAIILSDIKQKSRKPITFSVFGTDLDERAIQRARRGVYPESISVDVSPERLERYFSREGEDMYSVRKSIRDMLVFAPHNVLSDPPFLKIDLLVCRNLLIYLQQDLQKLLLPTFHYALAPGGILFLGSSESVGPHTDLFESLDTRWKIYRRKDVPTELPRLPAQPGKHEAEAQAEREQPGPPRQLQTNRRIERLLLSRFAPVSIVADRNGTIVYIHGRTGFYLEPEEQNPQNNIIEMAREGLRLPLSAAIHHVQTKDQEITRRAVRVKTNGTYLSVDLTVSPIQEPESLRGLLLITLTRAAPPSKAPETEKAEGENEVPPERVEELEKELLSVRESNQTMIEELQSSNEELQSSNEELQSTNEELQSSKEEMESLNEELTTVNNELDSKVVDLRQAHDDMRNLLNSTDLGVIFLDQQLRVKRYTEKVRGLISFRDSDIGRPIGDLSAQLKYDNLLEDCKNVLNTLVRKEIEVATKDGTWHLMRILPYRTAENVIGGVVITFVDISRLKESESHAESMGFFYDIVNTIGEPLILLDKNMHVQYVNNAFIGTFATSFEKVRGKKIYDLGNGQWDIPQFHALLEEILPKNTEFNDFKVEHDFPAIGRRTFLLNCRRLKRAEGAEELIFLAMKEKE
ncbi:MAG: PAS domain-containing protein [Chitinivibrionales bacterium]|nr:PAS domain-containing protein [Chitinivibrionales bacterium]